MKYMFLLFLLISCANNIIRISPRQPGVDPVFYPYIKEYSHIITYKNKKHESIYKGRINKLSINFSELNGSVIGRCYWLMNGEFEIEIDKDWWNASDFVSKKFLIYHELEHCIRFRMHTHTKPIKNNFMDYLESFMRLIGIMPKKGFFKDGCPNSVMCPYDVGEICNIDHHDDYIKEIMNYKDSKL